MSGQPVSEADPVSAWKVLESEPDSALVDVRTRAEWSFVGTPDLSPIGKEVILLEWRQFPQLTVNPAFVDQLLSRLDPLPGQILFICRSGGRSMEAAQAVADRLATLGIPARCVNVVEGFEGQLDAEGHRGTVNGWKARGLPWRQS